MTCKHCGERIIKVNNDYWTHQPAGSSFMDNTDQYCHITIATPKEE